VQRRQGTRVEESVRQRNLPESSGDALPYQRRPDGFAQAVNAARILALRGCGQKLGLG
jgi:hypothetical protein